MEFGQILKNIMNEKKLNQTQLAKLSYFRQSQISEWLSNRSKPGYDSLKELCKILHVSADKLLGL